jgi:hypothetical protein
MSVALDFLACNRVMLVHFDSYSAALHFAKWGDTLLSPASLPQGASAVPTPSELGPEHDGEQVKTAMADHLALRIQDLVLVDDFHHCFAAEGRLVRVHLLRFDTFEPPKQVLESSGGIFKPISELRGSAREELTLAREVFNLIIGAGGGRAQA